MASFPFEKDAIGENFTNERKIKNINRRVFLFPSFVLAGR